MRLVLDYDDCWEIYVTTEQQWKKEEEKKKSTNNRSFSGSVEATSSRWINQNMFFNAVWDHLILQKLTYGVKF